MSTVSSLRLGKERVIYTNCNYPFITNVSHVIPKVTRTISHISLVIWYQATIVLCFLIPLPIDYFRQEISLSITEISKFRILLSYLKICQSASKVSLIRIVHHFASQKFTGWNHMELCCQQALHPLYIGRSARQTHHPAYTSSQHLVFHQIYSASSQFKEGLCICFCTETRVSALLGDLIEPGPHPFQQPERPNCPSLLQTERLLYITSHLGKVCRPQIFSSLAASC